MPKIQVEDVMKVIDVLKGNVDQATLAFFRSSSEAYRDTNDSIGEHLYGLEISDDELKEVLPIVRVEVECLMKLAEENDAAYVRFI